MWDGRALGLGDVEEQPEPLMLVVSVWLFDWVGIFVCLGSKRDTIAPITYENIKVRGKDARD
jgi:hypothetical protein